MDNSIKNSSYIAQALNDSLKAIQNGSQANNVKSSQINSAEAAGDATWILTSAFIIFTMQSGFGLLEAGESLVSSFTPL